MPDHNHQPPPGDPPRHGAVSVTPAGSPVIHTVAWLALRTRGVHEGLTRDLRTWARRQHPSSTLGSRAGSAETAWPELATAWCRDGYHGLTAASLIVHTGSRLDAAIWILPATALDGRRLAVVGVDARPPTVYADGCRDTWAWRDADSLVITCPAGHQWMWRTGRELLTSTGRATTLTAVFGPDLDAPFTACPSCAHRDDGRTRCSCDRSPWIVCPTCGQTCTLTLPTP